MMIRRTIPFIALLIRLLKTHPRFEKEHGLIKITQKNYKEVIRIPKRTVIFFYDSECKTEHCKHSLFNFIESSHKALKHDLHQVNRMVHFALCDFAKVEVRRFKRILQNHDDDLPSIYLMAKTHPVRYNGLFDIEPLSQYFKNLLNTDIERTQQVNILQNTLQVEAPSLVYFGLDRETMLYSYFTTSTSEFHDINHIHADMRADYLNRMDFPQKRIALHTNFGGYVDFFTEGTYDDYRRWVNTHRYKQMIKLKHDHLLTMVTEEIPAVILVCHSLEKAMNQIKTLNNTISSEGYRNRLLSFHARRAHLNKGKPGLRLENRELPFAVIVEFRRGVRHDYYFDKEFTFGNLREWIGDWIDMRSHHEMVSEVSMDHEDVFVKKIVGHNFHREVLVRKKPAVILVHNGLASELNLKIKNQFITTAGILKDIAGEYVFGHVNQRLNNLHLRHYINPTLVFFPEHLDKKFKIFEETLEVNLPGPEEDDEGYIDNTVYINEKVIYDFLKTAQRTLKHEIPLVMRMEIHRKNRIQEEIDL